MDTTTPQTISPKGVILEFHEPGGEAANSPLFPQPSSPVFDKAQMGKGITQATGNPDDAVTLDTSDFDYLRPQLSSGLQVPQPYLSTTSASIPSRVISAKSSSSSSSPTQPARAGADDGTYTCTYHSCTLRLETLALLQKHKRKGHGQTQGNRARRTEGVAGVASNNGVIDSQAGPHRCDRLNPHSGKPCSAGFSRPYDLTHHEDTIYNARKQRVRCSLCTEDKTFSCADALSRHYCICHPNVELPNKPGRTRRMRRRA